MGLFATLKKIGLQNIGCKKWRQDLKTVSQPFLTHLSTNSYSFSNTIHAHCLRSWTEFNSNLVFLQNNQFIASIVEMVLVGMALRSFK